MLRVNHLDQLLDAWALHETAVDKNNQFYSVAFVPAVEEIVKNIYCLKKVN